MPVKEIRHDFATYDFKAWLAQLTQRVEQMHLPRHYAIERIAMEGVFREGIFTTGSST
jgi:hypothetical protein